MNFGPDPWLLLAIAALVGLGAIMVFNVSYFHGQEMGDAMHFFRKHMVSIGAGLLAAAVTSRIPSERLRQIASSEIRVRTPWPAWGSHQC